MPHDQLRPRDFLPRRPPSLPAFHSFRRCLEADTRFVETEDLESAVVSWLICACGEGAPWAVLTLCGHLRYACCAACCDLLPFRHVKNTRSSPSSPRNISTSTTSSSQLPAGGLNTFCTSAGDSRSAGWPSLFRDRFVAVVGLALAACRPRFLPLAGFSNSFDRPPIFAMYSVKISDALSLFADAGDRFSYVAGLSSYPSYPAEEGGKEGRGAGWWTGTYAKLSSGSHV